METKGTVNFEFLTVFLILLLVCSGIFSLSLQELSTINQTQNRKEARMVSGDISLIINRVFIRGDGYTEEYILPSRINQESYIVLINQSGVYVNSHYQLTRNDFIPENNLKSKNYILQPGNTYVFKNNNGEILIYPL